MTAAELVAKQDRQLRIDAHVKADREANRRDRDNRYGNTKRHPVGYVKPKSVTYRGKRKHGTGQRSVRKPQTTWSTIGYVFKLLGF